MASLESFGVDEYGNSNSVNLPDFTGCLLLATTPTPPAGTLVADGSEVSRASYPELFAKIGTTYGAGDGVTTFALPDWRDEFPRFSGSGRSVGSKQSDAIRNITGKISFPAWHTGSSEFAQPFGAFYKTNGVTADTVAAHNNEYPRILCNFDASTVVPTADENRPRNVAFLPCIVYE